MKTETRSYRKYTAGDDEQIRQMYIGGKSYDDIARQTGRSLSSLTGRIRKLKETDAWADIPPRKDADLFTPNDDRKLRKLHDDDTSYKDIAAAMGRTVDSIAARIKCLRKDGRWDGVECRAPKRYTAEEDSLLLSLRAEGVTFPDIARHLGRPPASVKSRAHKLRTQAANWHDAAADNPLDVGHIRLVSEALDAGLVPSDNEDGGPVVNEDGELAVPQDVMDEFVAAQEQAAEVVTAQEQAAESVKDTASDIEDIYRGERYFLAGMLHDRAHDLLNRAMTHTEENEYEQSMFRLEEVVAQCRRIRHED